MAEQVARWMLDQIEANGWLDQSDAAYSIAELFGDSFVYENENGNPAIDKGVLQAFRQLSESSVVWNKSSRYWAKRENDDEPGRQQS